MTLEELNRTSPFHAGAENTAFAPYFDGTSYLNMLSTEQVPVGCVTFAPGCRNHWHIHRAARANSACYRWTGVVSGVGRSSPGAPSRRRGEYPAQCQALARGGSGQRLSAPGRQGARGGFPKRVV